MDSTFFLSFTLFFSLNFMYIVSDIGQEMMGEELRDQEMLGARFKLKLPANASTIAQFVSEYINEYGFKYFWQFWIQ